MRKHATATVFMFRQVGGQWLVGLIEHPRFGKFMAPGGAVEADENAAEAAHRETLEETGYLVTLAPANLLPFASATTGNLVAGPMWIVEQRVPADGHLDEPHIHVDHLFIAVAHGSAPEDAELRFGWFRQDQLAQLDMFDQTRELIGSCFAHLDQLFGAGAETVPAAR